MLHKYSVKNKNYSSKLQNIQQKPTNKDGHS